MLPLRELPLIFHRPLPDPHRDARAVGNARLLTRGAGFRERRPKRVRTRGSPSRLTRAPTAIADAAPVDALPRPERRPERAPTLRRGAFPAGK